MAHCFLRNPDTFTLKSENIKIVKGDASDLSSLKSAMQGIQVVFSSFGTKKYDEGVNDRTKAMENIVAAAKHCNVKRVIAVGGAGLLDIGENKMLMQSEHFPAFLIPVSKDHLGALKLL